MLNQQRWNVAKGVRIAELALVCILATSLFAKPTLRITSPAAGIIVRPGQTVIVTVSCTGAIFQEVVVIAESPVQWSPVLTGPPYQFPVHIPLETTPGLYALTASGTIRPGEGVESEPISIDVERPDRPLSLSMEPASELTLDVGGQLELRIVGHYGDGSTGDLTKSRQTTYASQSPGVASVTNDGLVTAVAVGSTEIVIDNKLRLKVVVEK